MDPMEILPGEMWEKVFENVKDAQDWLNLYRASPSFEEVVGNNRQTALFPEVYRLLNNYLREDLDLGERLELRLVSRQWRDTIDQMIEREYKGYGECYDKYVFKDSATLMSFVERFEEKHTRRNPILGRQINFDNEENEEEDMEEFGESVAKALAIFGKYIRKLTIAGYTFIGAGGADRFIRQIRNCIAETPNLTALDVVSINSGDEDQGVENHDDNMGKGKNPKTSLSNLEEFGLYARRYEGQENVEQELIDALTQMCGSGVSVRDAHFANRLPTDLTTVFPNLTRAELQAVAKQAMSRLPNCSWPLLSELWLYLDGGGEGEGESGEWVDLHELFQYAQTFKDTLTKLHVQAAFKICKEDSEFRIDLPHLESLVIACSARIPLAYFTDMRNLREVKFYFPTLATLPSPEEIETEIASSKLRQFIPACRMYFGSRQGS